MQPDADTIRAAGLELLALADGFESSNEKVARRVRHFVRDALDLADAYEAEASGRRAMQANYQRALAVIQSRAYAFAIAEANPLL